MFSCRKSMGITREPDQIIPRIRSRSVVIGDNDELGMGPLLVLILFHWLIHLNTRRSGSNSTVDGE